MASRKKRTISNGDPSKSVANLYPEGVPLDGNGFPKEGAEIPIEVARTIPLDKTSARYAAQHHAIMEQKAQGKGNVKWHAVDRIRFLEVKAVHPQTTVSIEQISPFEDKSIPSRPIEMFQTLDDVFEYVKQVHWQGTAATYQWIVGDSTQPTWAQGRFSFGPRREEETIDMSRQPQQPPGYYPPPSYQPQQPGGWQLTPNGWWHPQFGYSQVPPMQAPPAPAPAAPAAPTAPVPPVIVTPQALQGVPNDVMGQLVASLAAAQAESAMLREQLRTQVHPAAPAPTQAPAQWVPTQDGRMWHPQLGFYPPLPSTGAVAGAPATAPTTTEPPKPKTVVEEANQAFANMQTLLRIGRKIATEFDPRAGLVEEEDAPATPPDQMPLKVQEVGPVRYVTRKDDSPVDATTQFMFNIDKIADFAKEGMTKIGEIIDKKRALDKEQGGASTVQGAPQMSAQETAEAKALERAEKLVELQERQVAAQKELRTLTQPPQQHRMPTHPMMPNPIVTPPVPPPVPPPTQPPAQSTASPEEDLEEDEADEDEEETGAEEPQLQP